jgi:hypothetical protein
MNESEGSDQPDTPEINIFAFKKPASTSGIKSVGFKVLTALIQLKFISYESS